MSSWIGVTQGSKKGEELSKLFLQWTERYLTNYKCDLANHPSLGNTLIRIPGTYNTKLLNRGESEDDYRVKVVYGWDEVRVDVKSLPFRKHIDSISKQMNTKFWTNVDKEPELALSYLDRILKIEHIIQPYIEEVTGVRKFLKKAEKYDLMREN